MTNDEFAIEAKSITEKLKLLTKNCTDPQLGALGTMVTYHRMTIIAAIGYRQNYSLEALSKAEFNSPEIEELCTELITHLANQFEEAELLPTIEEVEERKKGEVLDLLLSNIPANRVPN